jgi:hypothetical protein
VAFFFLGYPLLLFSCYENLASGSLSQFDYGEVFFFFLVLFVCLFYYNS